MADPENVALRLMGVEAVCAACIHWEIHPGHLSTNDRSRFYPCGKGKSSDELWLMEGLSPIAGETHHEHSCEEFSPRALKEWG